MQIKGILWHSTGANNPNLKRYVQPSIGDSNYVKLIAALGKNPNGNDWNSPTLSACVNAFIGKLANGSVVTVQTLPWDCAPWGCGQGSKGSCNNNWIQFEICEDNLSDKNYFNKVYKEACELTAMLCKKYHLDPHGYTIYNGVRVPVILCHKDANNLKLGSNHGDIYHWFNRYGKTMDDVRNDVAKIMRGEDEEMTQEQFNKMMDNYMLELSKQPPSAWSQGPRTWAESNNLIAGDSNGNRMYKKFITREEFVTLLQRFEGMLKR